MPVLERKELGGHPGRSSTPMSGGCAILFSFPFLLGGIGIVVLAYSDVSGKHAPDDVIAAVGVVFAAAGLLVFIQGVRSVLRRRRARRLQNDPVMADYPWVATHAVENEAVRGFKGLFATAFLTLFLLPFNWWAFLSDNSPWVVRLVTCLFDGILIAAVGYVVYLVLRGFKYGTSVLHFERFPFQLGERLDVRFESRRRIESASGIEVTLRCVQEAFETRGSGDHRTTRVVCYQIYGDTVRIDAAGAAASLATRFSVGFDLPQGEYESRLCENPPRYWEIEVKAETPGIDFRAVFLVPVYAKRP